MTEQEAGAILRRAYNGAPYGQKVLAVHLFGIKYARELDYLQLDRVVRQAGIAPPYATELNKMRNVGAYVKIKDMPKWLP